MFYKVDRIVNVCGFLCPEPMIIIRRNLRFMYEGEIMLIVADDPSTKRDIVFLCRFMKHLLIMKMTEYIPYCFLLRKGNYPLYEKN